MAKQFAKANNRGSIKDIFPKTSDVVLDLLSQMLEFNPYLRPTAETLLEHKAFEKIRDRNVEIKAPHKIILHADFNEYQYDYEKECLNVDNKKAFKYFLS